MNERISDGQWWIKLVLAWFIKANHGYFMVIKLDIKNIRQEWSITAINGRSVLINHFRFIDLP